MATLTLGTIKKILASLSDNTIVRVQLGNEGDKVDEAVISLGKLDVLQVTFLATTRSCRQRAIDEIVALMLGKGPDASWSPGTLDDIWMVLQSYGFVPLTDPEDDTSAS